MSPDGQAKALEAGSLRTQWMQAGEDKNLHNKMEWAGAFGDIGTLIPFVVAYITIVKVEPLGLLFMFGICLLASGFYYRTPLPVQPMKAIGAAAIAGGISPAALLGSGITTGIFWFFAGATGAIKPIAKLATKPVVRGIMLGLGLSFMVDGVHRMQSAPLLAGIGLVVTYLLLTNPTFPAMFVLLLIGSWVGAYHEPCNTARTCQNPRWFQAACFCSPFDYLE